MQQPCSSSGKPPKDDIAAQHGADPNTARSAAKSCCIWQYSGNACARRRCRAVEQYSAVLYTALQRSTFYNTLQSPSGNLPSGLLGSEQGSATRRCEGGGKSAMKAENLGLPSSGGVRRRERLGARRLPDAKICDLRLLAPGSPFFFRAARRGGVRQLYRRAGSFVNTVYYTGYRTPT